MSKKAAEQSRAARTEAMLKQQQRGEKYRNMIAMGAIIGVLAAILGVGWFISNRNDTSGDAAAKTPAGLVDGYGVLYGEKGAPMEVQIYEDPQCPACASFEAASRDVITQAVEAGKISVDYRMVSFLDKASSNEYSSRAMNALIATYESGGVEAFKKLHDELYANQPAEGGAGFEDAELIKKAVAAGATQADVKPAIEGKVYKQWIVNATDQMSKAGVTSTPTIFIDGKQVENTEALKQIQAALAQ